MVWSMDTAILVMVTGNFVHPGSVSDVSSDMKRKNRSSGNATRAVKEGFSKGLEKKQRELGTDQFKTGKMSEVKRPIY